MASLNHADELVAFKQINVRKLVRTEKLCEDPLRLLVFE